MQNRLSELTQRLRRISSEEVDVSGEYPSFLSDIIHEGQLSLGIDRISVWLFDDINHPVKLINVANTDWPAGQVPSHFQTEDEEDPLAFYPSLKYTDFPIYFSAISSGVSIAANDAEQDESTLEFNGIYLQPNGITTMLDTVIFKNGIPLGVVCCEGRGGVREWSETEVAYAEMIADCCSRRLLVKELWQLQQKLRLLAFQDALTGLKNRRYLMDFTRREISRHLRNGSTLSAVMVDLDHFKRINDKYGHDVGDVVLRQFSECCLQILRTEDCLCRLGGEEFLAVLPATKLDDAATVAERLRAAVEALVIKHGALRLQITASFGVCEVELQQPFSQSLKLADNAVYQAKRAGRNCVVVV
ncbi:sensor domain-containing diguanylate cyclase [Pseudoalteromonas xiamenensis]|uniref:diguanylate cyclase n=1 Tax=Pseudoalteromonas xiamenensis TaxID=882626 RepID=A0A975DG68_9GAMM|nr:sensor domain-containing diguanylate cyclase [Pseudoalteromonas xiamenensis]QTH70655.1 sensor domain-containing diguanylate cyclase [Pseudoalteromonas xiamenensis]